MSSKRVATSVLNHENWDKEEEPEQAGTFQTASQEELKTRIIKKARRRIEKEDQGDGEDKNKSLFASFAGFKNVSSSPFSFLSKTSKENKIADPDIESLNCADSKKDSQSESADSTEAKSSTFSFLSKINNNEKALNSENSGNVSNATNILENLNRQFILWLADLLDKNPKRNLSSYLKQYESCLEKLIGAEEVENIESTDDKFEFDVEKNCNNSVGVLKVPSSSKERINVFANIKFPALSFENTKPMSNTEASHAPLFNFSDFKSSNFGNVDTNLETYHNVEVPKNEFKAVVEEDSIYSKRCKVFFKIDGDYKDHGVGTLYLKPVKESEKTQLIVRADTNIGNILLNFILSKSLPSQRLGKNNVMVVCVPTPEGEQKPVSILIRVKTEEDADELFNNIEKYKKLN